MFAIFTGVPHAGKTLNLIKYVCEDRQFQDRQVYQYGIKGCRVPGWITLTKDQFENWYEFVPNNSVLVLDECQKFWRVGTATKDLPLHLTEIEEHRHKGIDIVATCQATAQLHTMAKVLVGMHRHYTRPHGKESFVSYEYSTAKSNPDSESQKRDAIKVSGPYDSKYFDMYDSATSHTMVNRFPLKYKIYAALALLSCISLIAFAVYHLRGLSDVEPEQQEVASASAGWDHVAGLGRSKAKRDEFTSEYIVEQMTPVIPNRPDTAPIYSALWEAKDYPRPQCVEWDSGQSEGSCVCYSQQATVMRIDSKTCKHIISKGRTFDHRIEPYEANEDGRARSDDRSDIARKDEYARNEPQVRVVRYTGRPTFANGRNSYKGIR